MIIMSQRRKSSTTTTTKSSNNKKNQQQRVPLASNDSDDDDDDDDDDEDKDEDESNNKVDDKGSDIEASSDDEDEDEEVEMKTTSGQSNRRTGKTTHMANTDIELCPVPTFQLPSSMMNQTNHTSSDRNRKDQENHRYELWTLRVPSSVYLPDLNDCSIPILQNVETFQTTSTTNYQFLEGQPVENESFRLLTTANEDVDSTTAETTTNETLRPSSLSFQKHFNVVMIPSSSPNNTKSNTPSLPQQQQQQHRHAYAPVPQKKGLKRRWLPFGTIATAVIPQPSIETRGISTTDSEHDTIVPNTLVMNGLPVAIKDEDHGVNGLDTLVKMELEDEPLTSKTSSSKKKRKRNDDDSESKNSDRKKKKDKKEEKKAMKKEHKQEKKKKNER